MEVHAGAPLFLAKHCLFSLLAFLALLTLSCLEASSCNCCPKDKSVLVDKFSNEACVAILSWQVCDLTVAPGWIFHCGLSDITMVIDRRPYEELYRGIWNFLFLRLSINSAFSSYFYSTLNEWEHSIVPV